MTKLLTAFVIIVVSMATGTLLAQDVDSGLKAAESGDFATALKIWTPLAEQGDANAQYNLGLMYDMGEGVTQDYAEAVKWYRLAAEQGYAGAQYNLGVTYGKGEGVIQDTVAAHMWLSIAAANGYEDAIKVKDMLAKSLSSSQLVEAQQKAKRCIASGYKDCDSSGPTSEKEGTMEDQGSAVGGLVIIALYLAVIVVPIAKILRRVGFSYGWAILAIVPLLNLIALWSFAFMKWPIDRQAR